MDVALWVVQIVLAVAYFGAGAMKALLPEEKLLAQPQMGWVADAGLPRTRLAGAAELVAVLGLILPGVTGIAEFLTPLAALGLVVIMVLAVVTVHLPRKETIVAPAILGLLAAFVAIGRLIEPL